MSTETPEQMAVMLGPAADVAEQGFLAAGRSLEGAIEILDRLTRRFTAYVAELTEGSVDKTRDGLSGAATQVGTLAGTHQSDLATLHSLGEIIAAVEPRVAGLQPITRDVQMLSLSARVVAGSMGSAATDFLAFSESIQVAADDAQANLRQVRDDLARMDHELCAARDYANAFARRHGDAMQAIPARLAADLETLTAQQQLAAEAAFSAGRQSETVRQQVAQQIVALQLGDITRQRLEHVQEGGRLLAEHGWSCGLVNAVLAAQLNDTADELAHQGELIEAGLLQLALAARAIGQLGAQVHGEGSGEKGGFVAAIEADIQQTAPVFTELRAADGETDRRMAAVLEASGRLVTGLATLQSVEEDIRITGLNATFRCGRLGPVGRPLAAVAQELRACSSRFGGDSAAVLGDLDRLKSIAAGLRDPAREAGHVALAKATSGILAALEHLSRLEHELKSALAQLQADADEVGLLAENAVSQFAVRHALAATLRQVAAAFDSANTGSDPDTVESRAIEQDLLERIAAGYTMAREREVHSVLAPLAQPPAAATPVTTSTEFADILF